MTEKARLSMLDRRLHAHRLLQGFLQVPRSYQVIQLHPERLARHELHTDVNLRSHGSCSWTYLYPVLPLPIAVVSDEDERADLVGNARVSAEARLCRSRLDRPVDDVPVLLLERLSRAPCDLLSELDGVAGLGVTQIRTRVLPLEQRCIQDVCARVLERR